MKEALPENPDYPLVVTDENIKEVIGKYPFLVVDCWAEWCGPCKMIGPVIKNLASKHKGEIVFGKLDVDSNNGVASELNIRSIPTLIVFKSGKQVGNIIGAMPEDQLLARINALK